MTRAMEQVGAGLEKIVAGSLRRSPAGEGPLRAWAVACGQAVAARTRAVAFAQGILRVEVPDAGWRAELQALAPQYLAVLNRYVAESVRRIEFVIVGQSGGRGRPPHTDMKVTEKDVAYVADLGNLELTEEERTRMVRDLNSILGHIDSLNELDTTNVPPMAQVSDRYGVDQSKQGSERFAYASREDVLEGLRKSLPHDVALENAPDSDGTFFKVPKVIER